MIVDGKLMAEALLEELKVKRLAFSRTPKLGIVMGKGDAATESYVRIKTRVAEKLQVEMHREELKEGATTDEAVAAVEKLARECDGVIVQLPLPETIDTEAVLRTIPQESDIDGVNPDISDEARVVQSPVAEAVREILSHSGIEVHGKKAAIIGQGRLVGKPTKYLLEKLGATTYAVSRAEGSLSSISDADIIVSGAGAPGIIAPYLIKEGVVLIDAGTSEQGGKMLGDADPACAEKAALFTPVPGGVGPIAVAMIFKNLFELLQKKIPA